jgi:hypothetical protein
LIAARRIPRRAKPTPVAAMIVGAEVGRTIATTNAMSGHHERVPNGAGMIHWLDSGGTCHAYPAHTAPFTLTGAGRRTSRPARTDIRCATAGSGRRLERCSYVRRDLFPSRLRKIRRRPILGGLVNQYEADAWNRWSGP